jgi:hypothetical protein
MKQLSVRLAAIAALALLGVGSMSQAWAQDAKGIRLTARKNVAINGFEAQLRGDYRESGTPTRLNAELEHINIPTGTKVAFCTVRNGVSTLVGVGSVRTIGGVLTASVELNVNDGEVVPNIDAGNLLQARQRTAAPFIKSPTCGSQLMISAPFQQ